jgi:hypothetical protein
MTPTTGQTLSCEGQIAISFAGEDRDFADDLDAILVAALDDERKVFFYPRYEERYTGQHLPNVMQDIYEKALIIVVIYSKHHAQKDYPRFELHQGISKNRLEPGRLILLLRDDTPLPAFLTTHASIDARNKRASEVAPAILAKYEELTGALPRGRRRYLQRWWPDDGGKFPRDKSSAPLQPPSECDCSVLREASVALAGARGLAEQLERRARVISRLAELANASWQLLDLVTRKKPTLAIADGPFRKFFDGLVDLLNVLPPNRGHGPDTLSVSRKDDTTLAGGVNRLVNYLLRHVEGVAATTPGFGDHLFRAIAWYSTFQLPESAQLKETLQILYSCTTDYSGALAKSGENHGSPPDPFPVVGGVHERLPKYIADLEPFLKRKDGGMVTDLRPETEVGPFLRLDTEVGPILRALPSVSEADFEQRLARFGPPEEVDEARLCGLVGCHRAAWARLAEEGMPGLRVMCSFRNWRAKTSSHEKVWQEVGHDLLMVPPGGLLSVFKEAWLLLEPARQGLSTLTALLDKLTEAQRDADDSRFDGVIAEIKRATLPQEPQGFFADYMPRRELSSASPQERARGTERIAPRARQRASASSPPQPPRSGRGGPQPPASTSPSSSRASEHGTRKSPRARLQASRRGTSSPPHPRKTRLRAQRSAARRR